MFVSVSTFIEAVICKQHIQQDLLRGFHNILSLYDTNYSIIHLSHITPSDTTFSYAADVSTPTTDPLIHALCYNLFSKHRCIFLCGGVKACALSVLPL